MRSGKRSYAIVAVLLAVILVFGVAFGVVASSGNLFFGDKTGEKLDADETEIGGDEGNDDVDGEPEDDKTDVPPTVDVPDKDPWADVDWANYDWGTIEYQLQTYCIEHSEWGLVTLYEDGAVQAYGRMIQDLSNYGMTGYQITRTYIYGYWTIEVDRDDKTTMYINYTYIEDYDSGEGREYEKTMVGIEGIDGNITFNSVTIPMYMPQYGMLYDTCTTDDEWTYFLDSSSFVDVCDIDAADAYFDELGELRDGDTTSTGNGGVTVVLATFTASSVMSEGEVYAYLYSNGRADINNDFFASTCSWTYEDGVLLLINDNGTDTYEVTIDGNTASFDYSSMGMSYTFVCDDISSFLELF